MSSNARPPAPNALPVAETVRTVLTSLRQSRPGLGRAALGPFTAIFLIEGGVGLLPGSFPPLELLAFIVVIVATSMFLVDAHRVLLLGDAAVARLPRFRPERRDLRYLGRSLLVGLTVGLAMVLPVLILAPAAGAVPGGVYALAVVITLLGVAGMLAVGQKLPATAVDRDFSIADAWARAKGRLPGILGVVVVLVAPVHVLAVGAAAAYAAAGVSGFPVVPALVVSLIFQFAELSLFAAILSLFYQRFSGVDLAV